MVIYKNKKKLVVQVKEKERISNNCSVGTYYFNDAEKFSKLAKEYINDEKYKSLKEYYIAPFYDYAISCSYDVYPLECENVKV